MKHRIGFFFCWLGLTCIIFAGILAAVHIVGTDAELYHSLQMKAGILESAGISEADLISVDHALADYLSGNASSLNVSAEVFGRAQPAFNLKEQIHMEDCQRLFALLRTVMHLCAGMGATLAFCGLYLLRDRRRIRLAAWLSPLTIAIPLGALGVWALIDFGSAFQFFHKILFTNDLWLLDPTTDLLIRICPTSMFMAMGARISLAALAWALTVPALVTAATFLIKERIP